MIKTDMSVCVGKKNGCDVWRVVWAHENHYVVKWNKKLISVDKDIEEKNYTYTQLIR